MKKLRLQEVPVIQKPLFYETPDCFPQPIAKSGSSFFLCFFELSAGMFFKLIF